MDVVVIGAGIAGLHAAQRLETSGARVRLLEARDRVGGRAHSIDTGAGSAIDLGPAWLWPVYQPRIRALIDHLGLEAIPQYEEGDLVYEGADGGLRRMAYPKRYGDAQRLRGGLGGFAAALQSRLRATELTLGCAVTGLSFGDEGVAVTTAAGEHIRTDAVVLAVPPALMAQWSVSPAPGDVLRPALTRWPTWMAAHAKLVLIYDRPFWRKKGLSGSAVSLRGPLMEVVDHSDDPAGLSALFGFFGVPADQRRELGPAALQEQALDQLSRFFGDEARQVHEQFLMDWSREPFTATDSDRAAPASHPPYGEAALRRSWYEGRLVFAAAEAAAEHGGLVEGALLAAEVAVDTLLASANRA